VQGCWPPPLPWNSSRGGQFQLERIGIVVIIIIILLVLLLLTNQDEGVVLQNQGQLQVRITVARSPQAAQCLARLADGAPTDFQMALVGAAAYAEDRWDAWLMGFKWGFEWIPKKVDVTGSIWKP
jgi:predicted metalloprotease